MERIRTALVNLAVEEPTLLDILSPITRQADKWQSLPKGWTQESVTQFWESLTGDNKHKVTKCIKEMTGKVDDPGAFCASLADKVMGPEWRSKKADAGAEADVAAIDRASVQYLKHVQDSLTAYHTKQFPTLPAPLLSPEKGPRWVRIVKYTKTFDRTAFGFINRLTGDIHKAESWKKPAKHPRGNVLDRGSWDKSFTPYGMAYLRAATLAQTWAESKVGFNKFNVPDLLSQITKVLEDNGLEETAQDFKQCRKQVDEAWKARGREAHIVRRWLIKKANRRFAGDIRRFLYPLLTVFQPHVKDYNRFIREFAEFMMEWDQTGWTVGQGWDHKFRTLKSYEGTASGDQIRGTGYPGFDPPEYAESGFRYPGVVDVQSSQGIVLRRFAPTMLRLFMPLVNNRQGFVQAAQDFVGNDEALRALGKLLVATTKNLLRNEDWWQEEIEAGDFYDWWKGEVDGAVTDGSVSLVSATVGQVRFKLTGQALLLEADTRIEVEASDDWVADSDGYDEPDYDDRFASRRAE